MKDRHASHRVTDVPPGFSERLRTRQRWYFALMGTCLVLLLPVAVLIANWREDH